MTVKSFYPAGEPADGRRGIVPRLIVKTVRQHCASPYWALVGLDLHDQSLAKVLGRGAPFLGN